MESGLTPPEYSVDPFDGRFMTSTQKGAIGEAIVSNALMLVSRGRFSPFKPVADDDGLDLLVFDKVTRQCVTLQVKARILAGGLRVAPRRSPLQFSRIERQSV